MAAVDIRMNLKNRLVAIWDSLLISQQALADRIGINLGTLKMFLREPQRTRWDSISKINAFVTEIEKAN